MEPKLNMYGGASLEAKAEQVDYAFDGNDSN